MQGFLAVTDPGWFEHLSRTPGPKDASFWRPSARAFRLDVGTPFLFKLRAPHHAIAGFGYFRPRLSRQPRLTFRHSSNSPRRISIWRSTIRIGTCSTAAVAGHFTGEPMALECTRSSAPSNSCHCSKLQNVANTLLT